MRTRDALLRRGAAHRGMVAAAFATVLLTLTLATTVALLHRAADDAAVTAVLTDATVAERVVQVRAGLADDTDLTALDDRVRTVLTQSLTQADPEVHGRVVSASYSLPQGDADEPDLTVFASYGDDLTGGADMVDGSWPDESAREPVGVAMPQAAAERLRLAPGDRWTVQNRFTDERVEVELSGVFVVERPDDPAWLDDRLVVRGVDTGAFTTYGPLVVAASTFSDLFLDEATGSWLADPRLGDVPPDDVPGLRDGVAGLDEAVSGAFAAEPTVATDLGEVLDRVETPLTATRAVVVLGAAPLVLLAAGALLTAGRLLGDRRRVELALLRARGASTAQLGIVALLEALAITAPAVLLAPPLARLLVAAWGPGAADSGTAGVGGTAWLVAGLAGLASTVILVLPSWRREGLTAAVRSAGGGGGRAAAQRVGADLLALVAAAVAAWQLVEYDGPLRDGEVDPLLVLAPGLLLLAGCLLVLRALPLALAAAQPWAGRSRGLTGALTAWTVSRRLGRQAGPALTVLLSASVIAFSLTWLASWSRSAEDRATLDVGADLRLRDVESLDDAGVAALPGVAAALAVTRSTNSFGDTPAELLAVDPTVVDDVVRLRRDLAEEPLAALLTGRATLSAEGLPLPESTSALALVGRAGSRAVRWAAVVQDGAGVLHAVTFEEPDPGGPLGAELGELRGPLTLLGMQYRAGQGGPPPRELDLRALARSGQSGEPLDPSSGRWELKRTTPGGWVLLPDNAAESGILPVLATRGLAGTVGDQTLVADAEGLSLRLEVVGVVEALPSVDPRESEGVLVALPEWNRAVFAQSGALSLSQPEWWLAVEGDPAVTVAAIAERHPGVTVLDRRARAEQLESGPVGNAVIGVLAVALFTAGLAALSGVVAAAGALGPGRRREAALLRALGAGPRQIAQVAALDRVGVLAATGLSGIGVGLTVAWWTLPRITLTDAAQAPYPPLLVDVPWTLLLVGTAAGLLAVLLVQGWVARRSQAAPSRGEELP